MRIAVIGSRDYPLEKEVRAFVRGLHPVEDILVSGGAIRGVDSWAEDEAKKLRLSRAIHEPQVMPGAIRSVYVAALFKRNRKIARDCDRMAAFWDGKSSGTMRTVEFARALDKIVWIFGPDGKELT